MDASQQPKLAGGRREPMIRRPEVDRAIGSDAPHMTPAERFEAFVRRMFGAEPPKRAGIEKG